MVFVDTMKWFINNLSNPYFTAFFSGFITFLLMYIDSKITRKEIHKRTYTKNILLVMMLTGTVVYILTNTSAHPKINKLVDDIAGVKVKENMLNQKIEQIAGQKLVNIN